MTAHKTMNYEVLVIFYAAPGSFNWPFCGILWKLTKPVITRATTATHAGCVRCGLGRKTP